MNKINEFTHKDTDPEYYKKTLRNEFDSIIKNTLHRSQLTIKYHGMLSNDELIRIKPIHSALKDMQCGIYKKTLQKEIKSAKKYMKSDDSLTVSIFTVKYDFYKELLDDFNEISKENEK